MTEIPATLDLTIVQGADMDELLTLKDNGVLINLALYTARMKIKPAIGGAELVSLTNTDGLVLGGAAGTIRIQRTAAQTAGYTWTRGVYDLELVLISTGFVTRKLGGNVIVMQETTT